MTYIVYADVMLITNSLINLFIISAASALQGKRIKIIRACSWSVLTALFTEIVYLLTLNRFFLLHLILYVTIYTFMTYLYFKWNSETNFCIYVLAVLCVMILLCGILSIDNQKGFISSYELVTKIILLGGIILFCCILFKRRFVRSKYLYDVMLTLDKSSVELTGYYDSGNVLTDDYTGNPVIIIDYQSLKGLFDDLTYSIILSYHNTGEFDYSSAHKLVHNLFYPIAYQTISTNLAYMPAFKLSSVSFCNNGKIYKNITACISRYSFKNSYTGDYQVLLNESLKPYREEYSND